MIEKYDITLYKSENFDILKYCYENYAHNVYVKEFIERMTVALEENNDMNGSIDNYYSDDLIEISLDEHDACYSCGHDANIYEDEFAIVPYVKHEIIAIAPILDSSFDEKHDCSDATINFLNVNCVNDMQNLKLGDASFAMTMFVAMIMIGVILLLILKIYLSPMMNMRLIIVFAILLKVGLEECQL